MDGSLEAPRPGSTEPGVFSSSRHSYPPLSQTGATSPKLPPRTMSPTATRPTTSPGSAPAPGLSKNSQAKAALLSPALSADGGTLSPRHSLHEHELNYADVTHAKAHSGGEGYFGLNRTRTVTSHSNIFQRDTETVEAEVTKERNRRRRRRSHDEKSVSKTRKFLIDVEETQRLILAQEDTDGDCQITVTDTGPKTFQVGTAESGGYKKYDIRGTYMLSNLLQELSLASEYGRKHIVLDEERLNENPVDRMTRLIKYHFWDGLTRRIDGDGLEIICADPKNRSHDKQNRIYVPFHDPVAWTYYNQIAQLKPHLNLDVIKLPELITPQFVKSINDKPGILSLALKKHVSPDGQEAWRGVPFVVPGGRFNEMYGWDSYFEVLGLIVDDRVELSRSMVENFLYQIEHYGKILNANRSYYLTRSQPPFLTDMALLVHKVLLGKSVHGTMAPASPTASPPSLEKDRAWSPPLSIPASYDSPLATSPSPPPLPLPSLHLFLARSFRAAIKELLSIWLAVPRLDKIGLSKFHPEGMGMPPETESSHFNHILEPFAKKYGVDVETFKGMYSRDEIHDADLDRYFVHDRAVRESGHDTTYRYEKRCADLATIDLNSLLYKYSRDIAKVIRTEFKDRFLVRLRKGSHNAHLDSFESWRTALNEQGIARMIGGDAHCWNTWWCKGVMVFDEDLDAQLTASFRGKAKPAPPSPTASSGPGPAADAAPGSPPPAGAYVELLVQDEHTFTLAWRAAFFEDVAARLLTLINRFLWNPEASLFFDYDCNLQEQSVYETATTFWALWAELATPAQAAAMVAAALAKFEVTGGLVSGTEDSRGMISLDRPNRQWDYPYGWAPHQIMAWKGLDNYGFKEECQRVCYRWLYTITKSFVDFNGVVPEKFDVVMMNHRVQVEYGNVGCDFGGVNREGFGWMNASFEVGLTYFDKTMRRALGALNPPDQLFLKTKHRQTGVFGTGPALAATGIPVSFPVGTLAQVPMGPSPAGGGPAPLLGLLGAKNSSRELGALREEPSSPPPV